MPMKSRLRIQGRESSAALALEKSAGLIPAGAVGAATAGAGGMIGAAGREKTDEGRICELAAPDNSNPPAPAAPSRNISLRFNDIHPSAVKRPLYGFEG
jgi:hypothetical protein